MDAVNMQQGKSTSPGELSMLQGSHTSSTIDFWPSFRLFPLKFDEYGFNHIYIFIIIYFLIILMLDFLFDVRVRAFNSGWDFILSKHDLTNWILISAALTGVLGVWFFNRWRKNIPSTFQALLGKGRITSRNLDGDISREFQKVLEDYQYSLLSKKRYILIAISMLIPLIFVLIRELPIISPRGDDALLWILAWVIGVFKTILPILLLGYFCGMAAWAMGITGLYVKNLTAKFDLTIQPSHPDHCGGLRSLGNFCLAMAMPLLIAAAFFGVYSIGASFYPYLLNGISIVQVAAFVGLIIFTLPLAAITFFVPLWSIHHVMIERKAVYEDEFADRIAKLEKKIQSSLDMGALEEAKAAKEEREIMQVLHPDKIGYPTWPFDLRILLIFLTPQLVPIIGLVIPLIRHT